MLTAQEKQPVDSISLQKKSETTSAVLRALIDKGILEEYYVQKDRIEFIGEGDSEIKKLNKAQEVAFSEIKTSFKKHDVTLLHGVTSSGKTEIYVRQCIQARY